MAASKRQNCEGSSPLFTKIVQPKFYKIIFSPQCTSMRIPKDFASRYCKNNLQNVAYLEVPSGKIWEVEVVHSKNQIWLAKGWQDFIDYHSISCGHFLMFGYNGRSHFNVTIFDLSATEIEYPTTENDSDDSIEILEVDPDVVEHSVENIGHCSFGQASERKRQDDGVEEDNDVSVDIQNNVIKEKESQGEHEQQSEVEVGEEIALNYEKAKAFKSNNPFIISVMRPSYLSHPFSLSIPKKFAKRYFFNHRNLVLSVTGKGSWSVKCTIGTKNAKFTWKAFVVDNKLKTGDVCVFEVIEGTMPVSINVIIFPDSEIAREAAEGVSDSEHQCSQHISAAYERAKAFTSENPFFIRVMQPSYVSGNALNIPRVIGWEFFSTKRNDLVLQVPNKRSWDLRCYRAKEYAKLTSGWKEFVFDNNIKAGDVCVFEQVSRSNRVFNVYIFPVDEHV